MLYVGDALPSLSSCADLMLQISSEQFQVDYNCSNGAEPVLKGPELALKPASGPPEVSLQALFRAPSAQPQVSLFLVVV